MKIFRFTPARKGVTFAISGWSPTKLQGAVEIYSHSINREHSFHSAHLTLCGIGWISQYILANLNSFIYYNKDKKNKKSFISQVISNQSETLRLKLWNCLLKYQHSPPEGSVTHSMMSSMGFLSESKVHYHIWDNKASWPLSTCTTCPSLTIWLLVWEQKLQPKLRLETNTAKTVKGGEIHSCATKKKKKKKSNVYITSCFEDWGRTTSTYYGGMRPAEN